MDSDTSFDALVEPLRGDTVSGASDLAGSAAEVLRRAAVRLPAGSVDELRWGLGEVSRRVLDAQPAMAPLVALVRDVIDAVEGAASVEGGRLAGAQAAEEFRDGVGRRLERAARRAAGVLPEAGRVATVSDSGTVSAALVAWARAGGAPPTSASSGSAQARRVLCFEGRPGSEGRALATRLAEAGLDVAYAVDAAAHRLVPACAAVLIGADSIGDRGVVNKIGSAAVAAVAAASDVPLYVASDGSKILPPGFPQQVSDRRPPHEVWDAPEGVEVWNEYFEAVPIGLVTAVVTESAVLSPPELEEARRAIDLPRGLRSWAESRG